MNLLCERHCNRDIHHPDISKNHVHSLWKLVRNMGLPVLYSSQDNLVSKEMIKKSHTWSTRVAQLVECLTLVQVMILCLVSLNPTSGSRLSASVGNPLQVLCPSFCPSPTFSPKWINIKKRKKKSHTCILCIYLSARIICPLMSTHQKVLDMKNTLNLSGKPVRMRKHCKRIARSWKLAKTLYPFRNLLKLPRTHQTGQPRWCPDLCQVLSVMLHTEQALRKSQLDGWMNKRQ